MLRLKILSSCIPLVMQVVWLGKPFADSTWKPQDILPCSLVADYEAGIMREIAKDTFTTGGQLVHTQSGNPMKQSVK